MTTNKISLYFLGTDDFAATILARILQDEKLQVLGVVTPSDKKVGRKQILTPCATKELALGINVPVFHDYKELLGENMDFLVTASYGYFLPAKILTLSRFESLNVHGSLLPKYRGASPIQAAILNGDKVTGISVMRMTSRMDAGEVFGVAEVPIIPADTLESLRAEMAQVGAELLVQVLHGITKGVADWQAQNESEASYAPLIDRDSGFIDWRSESAAQIEKKLRAYSPWPGVFCYWKEKRFKILSGSSKNGSTTQFGLVRLDSEDVVVETYKGLFVLKEVQLEGKNALPMTAFRRGQPDFLGSILI